MSAKVTKALGDKFTFTIANTSGALKVVALLAAFLDCLKLTEGTPNTISYNNPSQVVAAGYTCDAVCDDGTIATSVVVTAANSKMNFRAFRNYILAQPRLITDIVIQSNNVAAFDKTIEVVKLCPLSGNASQYIQLTEFLSVDQTSTNKINIPDVNLETAYDTLMLLPVDTGHTVTITFKFA